MIYQFFLETFWNNSCIVIDHCYNSKEIFSNDSIGFDMFIPDYC